MKGDEHGYNYEGRKQRDNTSIIVDYIYIYIYI